MPSTLILFVAFTAFWNSLAHLLPRLFIIACPSSAESKLGESLRQDLGSLGCIPSPRAADVPIEGARVFILEIQR